MEPSNNQESKGCSKCGQNKKDEKTCKTCKKNFNKFLPYMILSVGLFGFAIYGIVVFIKDMISLFSK